MVPDAYLKYIILTHSILERDTQPTLSASGFRIRLDKT